MKKAQQQKTGNEDWFSNVEQEIEQKKVPMFDEIDEAAIFSKTKPRQRQTTSLKHGTVFNKTQQFLNARGVGWLMEVEDVSSKSQKKENLLGGETELPSEEPSILEELDIDIKDILWRVKQVIVPFRDYDSETVHKLLLKEEGDFWGPFFIVLTYALLNISFTQLKIITWVFLIWFAGSTMLWFLTRLMISNPIHSNQTIANTDELPLDSPPASNKTASDESSNNLYFGQVVSFVGYGLIPHVLVQLLILIWNLMPILSTNMFDIFNLLFGVLALVWSTYSCGKLMWTSTKSLEEKKKLILWPILVLYLFFLLLH